MPTPPTSEPWTSRRLLAWMQEAFKGKNLDSPRLFAEMLLGHVLNQERLKLYTDQDREAAPAELQTLRSLVSRALKHEPVQYLTGQGWFFGLPMHVDSRVLVPRPCTETLVEEVLQFVRRRSADGDTNSISRATPPNLSGVDASRMAQTVGSMPHDSRGTSPGQTPSASGRQAAEHVEADDEEGDPDHVDLAMTAAESAAKDAELKAARMVERRQIAQSRARRGELGAGMVIADVCTGSGCIAIALAKNLPGAKVIASDVSADALEVAVQNARRHGVYDRIDFRIGNLLEPIVDALQEIDGAGLDVLVSNPPYIPDDEWESVPDNVKNHEPTLALRGGDDGLAFVAPLLRDGPALLKPGGRMLIELAACTAKIVADAAKQHSLLRDAKIIKDLEGHERFVTAQRG